MIANENIQDKALENFKVNQTEVTVFFLNGFQMKGVIEEYDKYVVSLNSQGKQHLIYKHAISTYTVETEAQESTESEE
ncbi:RNA chaperone Hfq [Staphylococcus aureus]|uniref:RNA chaperone Hfq n=1 Tax=Staphylococcus aureus TaxID=1280 RepID=UPI0001C0B982|nr:RNA chaperone Hfq [Staphylococcus aureus]EFB49402.1 host factor-I protein [Staphylococcus aureus subsp. aureus D139]MCB8114727.1 RNA chaperone Hfq [Staphylococcus aureus]MCC5278892.1 RNA chaperone Hfq [Staphylococcus aureus]MCS4928814.1 RNA chaperone Hfq [Staphylococcus aureus]MCS5078111.1 RNA chaperone Hfq [Staphylococcus aureus]